MIYSSVDFSTYKKYALTLAVFAFAMFANATTADAYGLSSANVNDTAVQAAAAPGDIRQGVGEASDYTIEFTLDASTTIAVGETVTLTFDSGSDAGEFFDFSNITAADITVYVDGTAIAATTDFTAAITTTPASSTNGVITLTAVTAFAAGGQEVSVVIGNGGGALTGTGNQIINPSVASEDADDNEASLGEESFYKITVSGTFGTEDGVAHAVKSAVIWPILDDDQVHVYAYIAPQLVFNLDLGDASYANGNNTSLAGVCTTGTDDDDDQNCDFFTDFANSIDFGMPVPTQTVYATPAHPTAIMDGGDTAQNFSTGGAHGFHVGTNAASGLVTTVWGETLTHTNGTDTIDAVGATAAAPTVGVDQFGFCLSQDTAGVAGTDATVTASTTLGEVNATIGSGAVDCATATYTFAATAAGATAPILNEIAVSTGRTTMTFFDMEYMVNVGAASAAGVYQTDLTFITTGLF